MRGIPGFIFPVFLLLAAFNARAQQKVILMKHADVLEYDTSVNKAQRLRGNVEFQHGAVNMYCDSAWFFTARNYIKAFGRIHVKQGDSLNLYGDSLRYDGNTRIAKLRGKIRLVEKDLRLVTDSIDFNMKKAIGHYSGGGEISSLKNQNILTSKTGYYHSKTKNIYFKDEVVLKHPDYTLYADTLRYHILTETAYFMGPSTIITKDHEIYTESGWYDTRKQLCLLTKKAAVETGNRKIKGDTLEYNNNLSSGRAFGHVIFSDTTENIEFRGERADYNEQKRIINITKSPLMVRYFEKDTLYVGADTMLSAQPDSGQSEVRAFHHVRIFKSGFEGIADSITYTETDSSLHFYGDPVLWYQENQLTADHIHILTYEKKIQRALFENNCFIISKADTVGYNQVKGRNMIALFRDNEVSKIRIYGNGQAVYFMGEEGKPYAGMNKTDCSDIELRMDKGTISDIIFITEPDATILPMKNINPKDKLLKNFEWRGDEKPGRFYLPETSSTANENTGEK